MQILIRQIVRNQVPRPPGSLVLPWWLACGPVCAASPVEIRIKTCSSHYGQYSSDLGQYANWYCEKEQPEMSDREFLATDDYVIPLDGFAKARRPD